jgi:hypothetical protein
VRLFVGTFIVFTIFALSPDVQAVPTFTWIEPWNVTLLPVTTQNGTPLGRQAFGSAATQSGQILDTTSDTAVAKAATQTRTGDAGVAFSREFELSGSPQGWNVSLTGVLNGSLLALGTSIGAHASVLATAEISPFLGLDLSREVELRTGDALSELSLSQIHTAFLSDGLYTVTGSLRTVSGALGGVALSDFFGGLRQTLSLAFKSACLRVQCRNRQRYCCLSRA